MSHPTAQLDEDDLVLKPQPRQRHTFDLSSAPNSEPSTPQHDPQPQLPSGLESLRMTNMNGDAAAQVAKDSGSETPSRTRSFLNLTSSTLFGIYQPNENGGTSAQPTPWGNGAQTPAETRHPSFDWARINLPANAFQKGANGQAIRRKSFDPSHLQRQKTLRKKTFSSYYLPIIGRTLLLFSVGILYGLLISHLHDRQHLSPVEVKINRERWTYLASWGLIGVFVGEAFPRLDEFWSSSPNSAISDSEDESPETDQERLRKARGQDWLDVVRSIGLFVGIAFAIRKLPWESTLQLSLTLALANPAIWYLIDRSPPGFALSTTVAIAGTAILLGINPSLIPSPSPTSLLKDHMKKHSRSGVVNATMSALTSEEYVLGIFSQETVGIATWIASVLFVSSVCFGNIGRKLASGGERYG